MKKLMTVSVALLISTSLAACGADDSSGGGDGGSPGEITIGSIHPLTGALAGAGAAMSNASKMAVADINADGGIDCMDGAKLKLATGDSEGVAATGQSEAQRLVDDGAVALVGTYQSDVTQNVSSVAERAGVPLVIDVAVDDSILEQGYKNTFRIQPNATSMGTDGADDLLQMAEDNGQEVSKVAYIHIEGAFGQSVYDAFAKEASSQGVGVSEVTYSAENFNDATTQVKQAASEKPDVIAVTGYYPDSLLVAKAVQDLDPDIDGLYGVANGGFDQTTFPKDAGKNGEGILSANYHYAAGSDRVTDIRDRFQKQYGDPMETASVLSYQAVEVIADGLEESCSDDPTKLRDAIAGLQVDDPLLAFDGPITFDDTGQNENATVIVMQIQGDEVEQVFPDQFATADVTYPTQ